MNLPKDPIILLSYINTKLRDEYPTLEDLCLSLTVDRNHIVDTLASIEYTYDPVQNRFI